MVTVYDVRPNPLIETTADHLETDIGAVDAPEWSEYVKTGVDKERAPQQENWWYLRAAAILRKVYMDGPVGVERLRSAFGSKYRNGHKTEHFQKASGKIIRTSLQQLEEAELVELEEAEGRKITGDGQALLDELAYDIHDA